ncbi:WLM-domain-containing protein [Hypoxylon sp. NC0597]|nr:WLM-domain-containing protein [Hypoxylon sp. NC0597]
MREHHILVTSLEEYEPNREFVGRNFNAGEVIQLVLKSVTTRQWLPFNYVQMVMMHELAHCKQMNHSKFFWAVRNQYADQMRSLWSRGYTGEGLWGRGTLLETGEFDKNTVISDKDLPEHLCGGTYRSRGRKRKQKKQLSYQERKERRTLKKFGANGVALGEDEEIKSELEKGKKAQGKPRVASSKRGRELRAAAALARFDQQKKAEDKKEPEDVDGVKKEDGSDSETVSDTDDEATVDINGQRLVDKKGHNLVRVCEDEDTKDEDAQNELRELFQSTIKVKREEDDSGSSLAIGPRATQLTNRRSNQKTPKNSTQKSLSEEMCNAPISTSITRTPDPATGVCPMCSFDSGRGATICGVCSHVLDPSIVPDSWQCKSSSCRDSMYLNAGDSGICGICGQRKGA